MSDGTDMIKDINRSVSQSAVYWSGIETVRECRLVNQSISQSVTQSGSQAVTRASSLVLEDIAVVSEDI